METCPTQFARFHREWLPARLAEGHGGLAAASAAALGSVALRIPGEPGFTYVPVERGVELREGVADATTVVQFSPQAWTDFVSEIRTAAGLLYEGGLEIIEGDLLSFVFWEPVFRALQHGRPIYDPEAVDLRDASGVALDLAKPFTLESDAQEMRHFLREAGFLHVRSVFSATEIDELRGGFASVFDAARAGDDRSWWVTQASGENALCRVIYANERSERLAALFDDSRVTRLVELMPAGLRAAVDRLSGITAMLKLPDVVEGLSDLPWHCDCGLGGHSLMCPMVSLGIHLDPITPESGELRVMPGSWGRSCQLMVPSDADRELGVPIAAAAGDCTLHFGDVMHASLMPTRSERGRRTLYLSYYAERAFDVIGPHQAMNDVLDARKDGQIQSLTDVLL